MKRLAAVCLVVVAVLGAPGFVDAAPTVTTATVTSPTALPISQTACDTLLDQLIADTKAKSNVKTVSSVGTVVVGDSPFASRMNGGAASVVPDGVTKSGEILKGNVKMAVINTGAVFGPATPVTLTEEVVNFEISKGTTGQAKMKWTFRGQTYLGGADSCTNRYWTATSSTSAIALKFGMAVVAPM